MSNTTILNTTITQEQHDNLLKQINPEKILAESKDKLENAVMEDMANTRAANEPIPSIINEAFIDNDIIVKTSIGNVKIRKLKAIDITIFKMTDSPIYRLLMDDIKEGEGKDTFKTIFPEEEVLFSLIYQFTHDVKDIYKLIKKDKEAYHDKAIEEVAFIYEPSDVLLLVNAILAHVGLVNKGRAQFTQTVPTVEDKKKV